MKNLFEQSRSHWVRYDRYELKTAADGKRYVTPAKDAKPDVYNPMKEMPGMVLDALNVGMLMMGRRTDVDVETAILEFVTKYGLLGLMTALPTTPSFHGLRGGLSAEEPLHQGGDDGDGGLSGAVLSL